MVIRGNKEYKYCLREDSVEIIRSISPSIGNVSSVFNTSFDVKIKDHIFNFTGSLEKLHPYSILLSTNLQEYVHPGMIVYFDFPLIKLGDKELSLNKCITGKKIKKVDSNIHNNVNLLKKYLKIFGNLSDFSFLNKYRDAEFKFEPGISASSYIEYFGCGDGLTPAFDDFFSGVLVADRFCGNNYIKTGEEFFNKVKAKTTLTSYWQARCADAGKLALMFEEVLYQLFCKKIKLKDILRCINTGHTSGSNILAGIEFYCRNCIEGEFAWTLNI